MTGFDNRQCKDSEVHLAAKIWVSWVESVVSVT